MRTALRSTTVSFFPSLTSYIFFHFFFGTVFESKKKWYIVMELVICCLGRRWSKLIPRTGHGRGAAHTHHRARPLLRERGRKLLLPGRVSHLPRQPPKPSHGTRCNRLPAPFSTSTASASCTATSRSFLLEAGSGAAAAMRFSA